MDFVELSEEFRKLEKEAGKKASSALLSIMDFKMQDFKSYIDQRFQSIDHRFEAIDHRFEDIDKRFTSMQWMMGIGFSLLGIIMVLLKIF
jgi:hypothetical protein